MFALLPYFALWSPLPREEQTLPPKSELVRFLIHFSDLSWESTLQAWQACENAYWRKVG